MLPLTTNNLLYDSLAKCMLVAFSFPVALDSNSRRQESFHDVACGLSDCCAAWEPQVAGLQYIEQLVNSYIYFNV